MTGENIRPQTPAVLGGTAHLGLTVSPGTTIVGYKPPPLVVDQVNYAPPVKLRPPQNWRRSGVQRVDLVIPSDDSGSMYGPGGDDRGVRRAAALSLVDLMKAGGGGRVGVVHWGSFAPQELVLPLTDVRRSNVIKNGLRIPPTLGGNNLPAALMRTREVLNAGSAPDRVPLVLVITDGIEDVDDQAETEIKALPAGCVHVLLVDHSHGCGPDLEACWSKLSLGSFTRLDVIDTRQVAWQCAEVLATALGTHMPPLTPNNNQKKPLVSRRFR